MFLHDPFAASGRLQTSTCVMTFEAESYPYKVEVDIDQFIQAPPGSRFSITFQTRNSKIAPWGGDVTIRR